MKTLYKEKILQAVDECHDIDLLDLVLKMLLTAEGSPSPDIITQEVKYEDNKRIMRIVPPVANGTCKTLRHPAQNNTKLAWRAKKPAGLCGQYDAGNIAA